MTFKILALGAVAALAAGAAAFAADDKPGEQRTEERVVIVTGPGAPHGGMHEEMDANKDGVITRDEFRALHDKMFGKLDKNGDGKITDDEFRGHHGEGEFNIRVDGPPGPGGHPPMHPGPGGDQDVIIIRHGPGEGPGDGPGDLDANKDGKISFEEFARPMREHFDEADKNKNGFLDKDEMEGRDHIFMFRRMDRQQ